MKRVLMIIAVVVIVLVLFFALRALYVLVSIKSFRSYWSSQNQKVGSSEEKVIVALGDSTVQGIGALLPSGSFVSQLQNRLDQPTKVYNYSVTGAESGEVLQIQVPRVKKLSKVDAIIIAVGPNDITHKKSLEDFLKNYQAMFNELPTNKIIVSNMPPMGPRDTKGRSSYEWGQALTKLANQNNVRVAKVYESVSTRNGDPRIYGGDFYHPSKAGYKLWADAFEPPLKGTLQ